LTDATVASTAFVVLAITPFPLWRRLAVLPQWQRLKPVMMAARVLGHVFFVLLAASSTMTSMPANELIERLLVSTFVVWTGALAVTLLVTSRRAVEPGEGAALSRGGARQPEVLSLLAWSAKFI